MKLLWCSVAIALTGVAAAADSSAQTMLQIRVVPAKPKAGETATRGTPAGSTDFL